MSWRRQLAVASPVSIGAVARAVLESAGSVRQISERAYAAVDRELSPDAAVLTDSGTSALVLALRLAVGTGGTVGFPGFACVDLAAAARFAGVRVRLYDLDPHTLGPDLASVERMLDRGVDAIVVAHLFGYAADVPAVRTLARAKGVTVIEDAAQSAGGRFNSKRLGTLGDLSVLSFGRGKGLCAAGGGALLGFGDRWAAAVRSTGVERAERGLRGAAVTAAQWALGRPSLYAIPSAIPSLHLGEMVFHEAHEPRGMSRASMSILRSAFELESNDLTVRRRNARAFDALVPAAPQLEIPNVIQDTEPGYLRYAARDLSGDRVAAPAIGVLQSYPRTLAEQMELAPVLVDDGEAVPGATELRRTLFTLPTHRFVTARDVDAIRSWLR